MFIHRMCIAHSITCDNVMIVVIINILYIVANAAARFYK